MARNRAEATARQAQSDRAEANDAAQALDDQLQQASIARVESDRLHLDALDALVAATATGQALTGDLATRTGVERAEFRGVVPLILDPPTCILMCA